MLRNKGSTSQVARSSFSIGSEIFTGPTLSDT